MDNEEKRFRPNLKRPEAMKVMFSESELNELKDAANIAGMGLSVYVRVKALEAARKHEMKAA